MILNQTTFERIRQCLTDGGYPVQHVAYAGAETVRDGNRRVDVVWFTCRDRIMSPRRGQRVAFTEDFTIAFTTPLVLTVSAGNQLYNVACSKNGRTISRCKKKRQMKNAHINTLFLNSIDKASRNEILQSMATHYGITQREAMSELVNEDAEHILDYLTEPVRSAAHVLMQVHRLANA